jgi:hypothetical protein
VHQFYTGLILPKRKKTGRVVFLWIPINLTADSVKIRCIKPAHGFNIIHPNGYVVNCHTATLTNLRFHIRLLLNFITQKYPSSVSGRLSILAFYIPVYFSGRKIEPFKMTGLEKNDIFTDGLLVTLPIASLSNEYEYSDYNRFPGMPLLHL